MIHGRILKEEILRSSCIRPHLTIPIVEEHIGNQTHRLKSDGRVQGGDQGGCCR